MSTNKEEKEAIRLGQHAVAAQNSTEKMEGRPAEVGREGHWTLDSIGRITTNADHPLFKDNMGVFQSPFVVGITGLAGSGKSTFATMLAEVMCADRYSFAAPIKEMLRVGLGVDKNMGEEHVVKYYGANFRHMAQTLGTEWGRDCINPDLWVIIAERATKDQVVVIDDVRFENEATWVRKNGYLIHIVRPGIVKIEEAEHSSEGGVAQNLLVDMLVTNDLPISMLEAAARDAAEELAAMRKIIDTEPVTFEK